MEHEVLWMSGLKAIWATGNSICMQRICDDVCCIKCRVPEGLVLGLKRSFRNLHNVFNEI